MSATAAVAAGGVGFALLLIWVGVQVGRALERTDRLQEVVNGGDDA